MLGWLMPTRAVTGVVLGCTIALLGCNSESALCDLKCDCEGCSDSEFDRCLDNFDDDFRKADRDDCLDVYDDWIACQDDTGRCDSKDDWKTDCKREKDRLKDCTD